MPLQKVFSDGSWKLLRASSSALASECCCEGPVACCLYSAEPEGEGGALPFPYTDLPATLDITFEGVFYPGATKHDFGAGFVGYIHPDYDSGISPLLGHAAGSGGWAFGDDGGGGGSPCLIMDIGGGTKSEDLFLDEYVGDNGGIDTWPMYRTGLCTWQGEREDGGETYTYYVEYVGTEWQVSIFNEGGEIGIFLKDDPQSSPEGSYEGAFFMNPP